MYILIHITIMLGTENHEGEERRKEEQKEKKGDTSVSIFHNKTLEVLVFLGYTYIRVAFNKYGHLQLSKYVITIHLMR